VKILLFKVKQIVDAYVNNDMAPRLLIDIPRDVASRIVIDADHLSPYLFHDANVSCAKWIIVLLCVKLDSFIIFKLHVFHLLLPLWLQFDQLRCANDLENSKDFLAFKSLKVISNFTRFESSFNFLYQKQNNKYERNMKTIVRVQRMVTMTIVLPK
jgi:hypothetical protein